MGRGELQRKAAAARKNLSHRRQKKRLKKRYGATVGGRGGSYSQIKRAVKATRRNILPLDFGTASLTGQTLDAIEKQREKLAKQLSKKNRTRTRATKVKRGRRNPTNPVADARGAYRSFHGRDSEQLVEVRTPVHEHTVLAAIGDLIKIKIKPADGGPRVTLRKFGTNRDGQKALLCMNERRTQMFIEGGDQSVDLDAFGVTGRHEFETLGKMTDVWYFTTKDHLRPEDGGTATYHHEFGKTDRDGNPQRFRLADCPDVIYDVRNSLISFSGGVYTLPDEGIDG